MEWANDVETTEADYTSHLHAFIDDLNRKLIRSIADRWNVPENVEALFVQMVYG
jgi:hypothetical protein